MSFKYSNGQYQVIGDLSGSDDSNRDTGIDFEENEIKLVAGGTAVFKVTGSDVFLADGSDIHLGTNSFIYFDGYDTTNDCYITQEPNNSMTIDSNNKLKLDADEKIIIQNNGSQKVIFNFNDSVTEFSMPLSSSNTIEGGTFVNNGGRKANLEYVTSTPYSVSTSHHMIAVNTDSAKTLTLPSVSNSDAGVVLIIMDGFGGGASAGANNNNITINAASGQGIGANSSYTINTMGGSVSLVALDSNGWIIFNKITS